LACFESAFELDVAGRIEPLFGWCAGSGLEPTARWALELQEVASHCFMHRMYPSNWPIGYDGLHLV
jgi:hypothetical protein